MDFLETNNFCHSWILLPSVLSLSITSCMANWHAAISLVFLTDTDQWDHLCKNVSWAEIQSGGRISETGVGSLPFQVVWSAWRHGNQGECKRYRKSPTLAKAVVLNLTIYNSQLQSFENVTIPRQLCPEILIQLLIWGSDISVFFISPQVSQLWIQSWESLD